MHPLMHKVIQGVKENDLHQCVKDIVAARVRRREDEKPVVLDPNHFLSTYRYRELISISKNASSLIMFAFPGKACSLLLLRLVKTTLT